MKANHLRLLKKIKNISFFKVILILSLLSFYIFSLYSYFYIFRDYQELKNKAGKSLGIDQNYTNLNHLATEVQINYFKKYLGDPVFINYSKDRSQKEYIFVDKDYYVQAITNSDDKVLSYAVTTRAKNFNPSYNDGTVKTLLGKSTFADLNKNSSSPIVCYGFLGNTTPSFYFEQYAYGNPGNYQTYLYGINDAGYWNWQELNSSYTEGKIIEKDIFSQTKETGIPVDLYDCNSIPQQFRSKAIINTYIVVSPNTSVGKLKFHFGVNRIQVRLIRE